MGEEEAEQVHTLEVFRGSFLSQIVEQHDLAGGGSNSRLVTSSPSVVALHSVGKRGKIGKSAKVSSIIPECKQGKGKGNAPREKV